MRPSWESREAWLEAAAAVMREGKRPTVATICPDCLRPVPRRDDRRYELKTTRCACGGEPTTAVDEYRIHEVDSLPMRFGLIIVE